MSESEIKQQKRAGKALYSGRRRTTTRKSGFKSHSNATGGRFDAEAPDLTCLSENGTLEIEFHLPNVSDGKFSGFGFYFRSKSPLEVNIVNVKISSKFHSAYEYPSFNKCGYIWQEKHPTNFTVQLVGEPGQLVELFDISCGEIWHNYFDGVRDSVLRNLHQFSPEANFYTNTGDILTSEELRQSKQKIGVKECNRCARYLPTNFQIERDTLSFSNHCVAKRPCKHKGFGILENLQSEKLMKLEYGFQLECRVCKKFVVNAPLNPQRSADQMKEDGQRRRHFELLISELHNQSEQMNFRHLYGKELSTHIWEKFGKKCFNCEKRINTAQEMNLDHTRPLALLWPLDGTATCLCKDCNSEKRDRYPSDFYRDDKLIELSNLTDIPLDSLRSPTPNLKILAELIERSDWLIEDFLNKDFLLKEKEGKISSELICKALDRVIGQSIYKDDNFSFLKIWHDYHNGS